MRRRTLGVGAVVSAAAALALFVVFIAQPAIMGTTWSDRRRANQLADDEIFAQLDQRWGARGDVGARPASRNFGKPSYGSVHQSYQVGVDVDPRHEMAAVASLLETAGWTTLFAQCQPAPGYWTISAFRADEYGHVSIDVFLVPPEESITASSDDGWIGYASILVGFAAEADDLGPPGVEQDLSCLE